MREHDPIASVGTVKGDLQLKISIIEVDRDVDWCFFALCSSPLRPLRWSKPEAKARMYTCKLSSHAKLFFLFLCQHAQLSNASTTHRPPVGQQHKNEDIGFTVRPRV